MADGHDIRLLKRPRTLLEMNHGKKTPYNQRICIACNRTMATHWQMPFKHQDQFAKWWCHRDGTQYAGRNFQRA